MINKKVAQEINKQINKELYSAYLYRAMAVHAAAVGYEGTARWMSIQEKEEQTHAQKFQEYLIDQNVRVELLAIDKPALEFGGLKEIFEAALKHEQFITESINNIMSIALAEKDYASVEMLQWFIKEQVEEEKNVTDVLTKLSLIGPSQASIYLLDKQIGKRGA